MQTATAIIAAGGAGLRMGAPVPKQFIELLGTPILVYTLRVFCQVESVRDIIVVAPPDQLQHTNALLDYHNLLPRCSVIAGGRLRQDSVRQGLNHVAEDSPLVVVHDAARPLVTPLQIERCLAMAAEHGAAIMAIPIKDTIKQVTKEGLIRHTVERTHLWRAQTPQAARTATLRHAFEQADRTGFVGTDEASLLEFANLPVAVVEGSETNLKITQPDDLHIVEALLGQKQTPAPYPTAGEAQAGPPLRIGHGFDAHRLVAGRTLVLGGVTIAHEMGLLGHSDADVLTHSLCDAILGAMGQGDIGRHFPDSDPQYKGISSISLLERVMALAAKGHYRMVNADVTVVAQRPKLSSHFPAMREILARACGVTPEAINLKATTTEKLGYTGREEGVSVHAVVMMTVG